MLTNKKYSGRKPLVVVAALLSLMILLPLAGCKNDTVPEPTRYTVKFDKNAEDATGEMASQTFTDGVEQELSANRFKRDTWTFSGWSEDKAATTATYRDKDKFKATKDTTLYAVWTDNGTVTFTPADGTTLYYGDTVTLSTTDGATIQYHLGDGSWQDYNVETKIQVTTSTTITAKATKAGLKDSTETKATYTVRQLTAITVTAPTKTVYNVGDSFDSTGMKVTANYDGGATRTVTGIITTDTSTLTESAGVKTVAVSYKEGEIEKSGQFEIRVLPKKLTDYTSPNHTDGSWTYVELGEWPQTIMADGVTVDETKSKKVGMFTYYLGSDGNWYVEAKENAYGTGTEYQYSNRVQAGQNGTTTKWFKVEPVVWRVLNKDYATTGKALLLAEKILTGGIKWADSSNNYQNSNIRKWLNGNNGTAVASDYTGGSGFLQTAFTQSAQNLIATTTVDNSKVSTNPDGNATLWNSGENRYACADTTDKIFLLSEKEATTEGYGFAAYDSSGTGSTRIRATTDYAKATGAYQSSTEGYGGWWWLRSPDYYIEDFARYINDGGYADSYLNVYYTYGGVVPALCVQLQ